MHADFSQKVFASNEVYRFKQSLMRIEQTEASTMGCYPGRFTQWIGDSIDHNVANLDGCGSFHGMVLIAVSAVLDRSQPSMRQQTIVRLQWMKAKDNISSKQQCSPEQKPLSTVVVFTLQQVTETCQLQRVRRLGLLWLCGWNFLCSGVVVCDGLV